MAGWQYEVSGKCTVRLDRYRVTALRGVQSCLQVASRLNTNGFAARRRSIHCCKDARLRQRRGTVLGGELFLIAGSTVKIIGTGRRSGDLDAESHQQDEQDEKNECQLSKAHKNLPT